MDVFERIRNIISPQNVKPQTPINPSAQRGLQAVNQIRSSLNITPKPTSTFQTRIPTFTETLSFRTPIQQPIRPTPQISVAPVRSELPRVQPKVSVAPIRSELPQAPKPLPTRGFEKLVPIATELIEGAINPAGVAIRALTQPEKSFRAQKTKETFEKAGKSFAKVFDSSDKVTAGERLLEGLSGVGTALSLPNEIVVQPIWDSIKLGYKGLRTGQITDQDIQDYYFKVGGEKGTVFDAIGTNETDFGKKYGDATLQAIRFLDFAPELLDLQLARGSDVVTFAREVKLPQEAIEEAGRLARQEDVTNAIARFEAETGQKITDEAKDLINKSVDNPKQLIDTLNKEASTAGAGIPPSGVIPPSGNIPTFLPPLREIPVKERQFPISVSKAEGTAKEVKNILKDRIDLYSPIKNKEEFARANKFVADNDVDSVIDYIKFTDDPREVSYIGQALMQKLQKEGNFARVIDVLDVVSEQGTRSGQTIQALSVWGRLSPEGALRTANNLIRKFNLDNKLTEGMQGFIRLTDSQAAKITEQANKLAKITDDYERLKQASILQREIADVVPASLGTKIATIQTLAQLLNPKTFIRNVLGNAIFGSIDSLTQTFATPLDLAISLYTKKRTVAPASLKRQIEGGVEGAKKGFREALEGADTTQLASQFDLPNGSVFDSKVMQGLEKALNVSLRAPDRAFYEASYKDTLDGLLKLNKTDTPTKEMLETAHYEALRRTFQDENRISKLFTSAKRALNYIGTKDRSFGLGDIILKYPKTPANLLVRALEYSPVNYVRAVMELARPLMGGAFDQRAFVQNIARATVGTGMINLGLSLGKLGILTPRPDSDKDARNAQDLQGVQSYSFNTSALKRYVLSGFDADAAKPRVGDQLFSYDWAQPASLPLAIGANLAETNGKLKEGTFSERVLLSFGPLAGEIIKSSDTLTEQSLLQGIQRLFSYGGLQQGLLENVLAIPQSFVPTILNQINQYTDNASRETYSPDLFEASFNQFSARVPFLAQRLPQRVDVLGRPKERFPNGSNTFFNVFFNPAFVDQIQADPTLKEVISLYEQTGEKGQFPRVVDKTITVNGEKKLLTAPEIINYQRNLGQLSDTLIKNAVLNKQYQELPTTEKALFLGNVLSDANKITKVQLFGESDTDLSGRLQMLQNNDFDNYLIETLQNKQEQLRKEQLKAQGLSYKKAKLPSIKKARRGRKITAPKPKKLKLAKVKTPKIKKPRKQKTIKLKTKV